MTNNTMRLNCVNMCTASHEDSPSLTLMSGYHLLVVMIS